MSRPRKVDLLLAGLCAALSVSAVGGVPFVASEPVSGALWWTLPLFLVPAAALLVRRTSRFACVVGVWLPVAIHAALTREAAEGVFLIFPAWTCLFALAAYGTRREIGSGLVVAVTSVVVHDVFDPAAWRTDEAAAWAAAFWDLLLFVPPLVGGWVGGARRASQLAERNATLELRRLEETQAAVSDERPASPGSFTIR